MYTTNKQGHYGGWAWKVPEATHFLIPLTAKSAAAALKAEPKALATPAHQHTLKLQQIAALHNFICTLLTP